MRVLWWASAMLAAALDTTHDEAFLFLSRCASGSLLEAAANAMDLRHMEAFPWSNAWMVLFCLLGHVSPGSTAWPLRLIFSLLAMAAAMPLACMAGGLAISWLPLAWPAALRVATWCLAMLGTCAAFMRIVHAVFSSFSAARHVAPHSSSIH